MVSAKFSGGDAAAQLFLGTRAYAHKIYPGLIGDPEHIDNSHMVKIRIT